MSARTPHACWCAKPSAHKRQAPDPQTELAHDAIEWLGTEIEAAMRCESTPDLQRWLDATVDAHVFLTGCEGHKGRKAVPA